ncbi:MAG TPA: FlgD immunoglobulin-like domain containing protein [Candidatus Krumholzibacteria bacterium]|nr:FlgD immunoglobulin-like domain containing protein [Candidatus Krumholzibacteria bacterium]HPD72431.1 FlgD immunoglobulin-like domain containing protein [Candidatus Krumholzibacteria bacterium]HRY40637.1 FlgD immunoglobulin-like domain containing protein [Candidatus Krumholzibacteria bacterium]
MRRLTLLAGLVAAVATPAAAWSFGGVLTSDYYSSAAIGRIQLAAPWTITPDLEPTYPDAIGVWHGDLVYIVNRRGADNIQILDPARDFTTVDQVVELGPDRGLKHLAFLDDGTAYVSCYDRAELLHVDLTTHTILHVVSTLAFADGDGLPETGWLLRDGDRLFVTCERLDRGAWYSPVGDSYLLVLDLATREWVDCDPDRAGVQGIQLAATNPYCEPVRNGSRLLVGCSAFFGLADGGVDVVDLVGLRSLGLEITEDELGGDVVDVAGGAAGRRHVVVADADFRTAVKAYRPGEGVVSIHEGVAYDHADLAYDGDVQLFVADRRLGAAGVRVFDAASGVQLTAGPLATGLPPASFVLPANAPIAVGESPPAGLSLAAPWPNPANPGCQVAFTAAPAARVELRVVDLRGRLVQRGSVEADAAGRGRWEFSGLDAAGRPVASGVYRVIATSGADFAACSLTLVR